MKIKDVQKQVYEVLVKDSESRADDNLLYALVCRRYNPIASNLTFDAVLCRFKEFGLPSFESVSRARRKLQADYSELRPPARVVNARYEKYKEIKEYAKG